MSWRQPARRVGAACVGAFVLTACTASPPAEPGISADVSVEEPEVPAEAVASPTVRHSYGDAPRQFGVLAVPAPVMGGEAPHPVVVLIHGGFWRNRFTLELMTPLLEDLVERGYAVWNIEYRSAGDAGGGYPGTLTDVAAAVDHLAALDAPLDLERVAVVGHSAGGHLAAWIGSRSLLQAGDPGASPAVDPVLVVPQAGVVDLFAGHAAVLGAGAVDDFMGGSPEDLPDAYRVAQPVLDQRARLVHGDLDSIVPPSQSLDATLAAVTTVIDGADHFDVIDPAHESWAVVVAWLDEILRPTG